MSRINAIKPALPAVVLALGLSVSAVAFAQQQYPGEPLPPQQAAPDQAYPAPPSAYPPPAGAYPPPPPEGAYAAPPPGYAEPPAPVAPPGAVWVGAPGECLYGNGAVYWCAPGVVFSGFPAWWDFGRFPVAGFGPGIVVDPVWFNGWRFGHPGFAFRGRFATDAELHAYAARREDFARNGGRRPGPGYGRPDDHHDGHY